MPSRSMTGGRALATFDTGSPSELREQMQNLRKTYSSIYSAPGQIAGLAVGAHGFQRGMDLNGSQVLRLGEVQKIFDSQVDLFAEDAIIFLASCYNGEGREHEANMANAFSHVFPGRSIYSCDQKMIGFSYELDESSKVLPASLRLQGMPSPLSVSDCTYVARCTEDCTVKALGDRLNLTVLELTYLVQHGITDLKRLEKFSGISKLIPKLDELKEYGITPLILESLPGRYLFSLQQGDKVLWKELQTLAGEYGQDLPELYRSYKAFDNAPKAEGHYWDFSHYVLGLKKWCGPDYAVNANLFFEQFGLTGEEYTPAILLQKKALERVCK